MNVPSLKGLIISNPHSVSCLLLIWHMFIQGRVFLPVSYRVEGETELHSTNAGPSISGTTQHESISCSNKIKLNIFYSKIL